jgi:hypothetical protein
MALTITFKEVLDAAGLSGSQNTGGDSFNSTVTLLSNKIIRGAIARNLKDGWAKNELSELFVNVNDRQLISDLRGYFKNFLDNESSVGRVSFADNPIIRNVKYNPASKTNPNIDAFSASPGDNRSETQKSEIPTDPILILVVSIRDRLQGITPGTPGTKISPEAGSFDFNCNRYSIIVTDEEVASLNEQELASLSSIGSNIRENLIVPQSAVMMAGSPLAMNYQWQGYPTFTGIDLNVVFLTPQIVSTNITVKTLTYSMHSGLTPVSTLGRSATKGFAKGKRNIAGTMICTITINDPLMELQPVLYTSQNNSYAKSSSDVWRTYLLPDQFPIFDILCVFNNEYGFSAVMPIFGVKIVDVGSVVSMSDSEIEVTYSYIAMDIDVLRSVSYVTDADGTIRTIDILANNEYLAKRERALKGESEHRGTKDISSLFAALDRRSEEIAYQKLRSRGASLGDVIKLKEILDKK